MKIVFFYSSKVFPVTEHRKRGRDTMQDCNDHIGRVLMELWEFSADGLNVELTDIAMLSDQQVSEIYKSIIPLSIAHKYSIRRVFGTKHTSGDRFGRQVPALLAYDEAGKLFDIYPRMKIRQAACRGEKRSHYPITIFEGLEDIYRRSRNNA
ncbi:hypothetical protein DA01_04415 [Dehalococcoides mccartyi]|uniref:Uncharacterized protein n=1 Tax=Dehalococcoides mccartyi TaxID=61435 RepID=A0A0V8M2Y0_9CHLR|nr:hypothetical protein [Dehalococcoides mccartyi]KSV18124.1 hypothetical protein DA01_04415 [Dehalococcoides mccartyi]